MTVPSNFSIGQGLNAEIGKMNDLLQYLRAVPRQVTEKDKVDLVNYFLKILKDTYPPKILNAAALGLLILKFEHVGDTVDELLQQRRRAEDGGTLLYVLRQSGSNISLASVLNILENGSYESRSEVLILLGNHRLKEFNDVEAEIARAKLKKITERFTDFPEVIESIELASEYLDEISPAPDRGLVT